MLGALVCSLLESPALLFDSSHRRLALRTHALFCATSPGSKRALNTSRKGKKALHGRDGGGNERRGAAGGGGGGSGNDAEPARRNRSGK